MKYKSSPPRNSSREGYFYAGLPRVLVCTAPLYTVRFYNSPFSSVPFFSSAAS